MHLADVQMVRQRFDPCGAEFRHLVHALGRPCRSGRTSSMPNTPFVQWLRAHVGALKTVHGTDREAVVRVLAWHLVTAHPSRFALLRDVLRLPAIARIPHGCWTVQHAYKILLAVCVWTPDRARIPYVPPMAGRSGMK